MIKDYRLVIDNMLKSINTIDTYTKGVDEIAFSQNKVLQDAVLLQLVLVGEAVSKLPDAITSQAPEIPWIQVKGFRNIVIHEYSKVSLGKTWDIVIHDLPTLKVNLTEFRAKLPDIQPPKL